MIKIRLNGQEREVEAGLTIAGLLESLGFQGKAVVVELDEMVVFPRDYDGRVLLDGSRVEVVALAAGG